VLEHWLGSLLDLEGRDDGERGNEELARHAAGWAGTLQGGWGRGPRAALGSGWGEMGRCALPHALIVRS
jgi:hypothetical protein